jgi:hypothetical protein
MSLIPVGKHDTQFDISDELRLIVDKVVDWQKLANNHFIKMVEMGRQGRNVGWSTGIPNMDMHTHGKHRGRYYLIGADSGVGKTTFGDFIHLLESYRYAKAHGLKWYCYYYSFELAHAEKIARWVSYYLAIEYGVTYPSNFMLGRINGNLPTDEDMVYIRIGYAFVEEMLKHMIIIEDSVHPTKIFHDLIDYHYEKYGTIERNKPTGNAKKGSIIGYTAHPGEELAMVDVFVDHLALTHGEQGLDTKGTIDLLSKYAVALRNLFGTTFTFLQQFSTDMQTWHRNSKKITDKFIAPQRLDFGDSKYTYRDADVVYGLVNPYQFELETYFRYEVEKFQGYLLGIHIMKNRYGTSSVMVPVFLNPLTGIFEQMPKATNEIAMERFIDKASKIVELCQKFSPKV